MGAWLGKRISAYEVAVMMSIVKLSRMKGDPVHGDNYEDAVSYLEIARHRRSDISESLFDALTGGGKMTDD